MYNKESLMVGSFTLIGNKNINTIASRSLVCLSIQSKEDVVNLDINIYLPYMHDIWCEKYNY